MSGLLIAAIAAGTVTAVELPDNSGLAGLVLRADADDGDEVRLKADAAGFWGRNGALLRVIALGDLGNITIANLAARYHGPGDGGYRECAGAVAGAGAGHHRRPGQLRILPMRWISRVAALVMVVMAAFALPEASR
ncbi:MAG: hypothetical protein ACRDN0_15750 [Trebonia sp.]